jgi:hypothetical protein
MAQEKEKKKRNYRKQIIWTAVVLTGPVWGLTLLLSLTNMGVFGELPNIAQIANPETKLVKLWVRSFVKTERLQPSMNSHHGSAKRSCQQKMNASIHTVEWMLRHWHVL